MVCQDKFCLLVGSIYTMGGRWIIEIPSISNKTASFSEKNAATVEVYWHFTAEDHSVLTSLSLEDGDGKIWRPRKAQVLSCDQMSNANSLPPKALYNSTSYCLKCSYSLCHRAIMVGCSQSTVQLARSDNTSHNKGANSFQTTF